MQHSEADVQCEDYVLGPVSETTREAYDSRVVAVNLSVVVPSGMLLLQIAAFPDLPSAQGHMIRHVRYVFAREWVEFF